MDVRGSATLALVLLLGLSLVAATAAAAPPVGANAKGAPAKPVQPPATGDAPEAESEPGLLARAGAAIGSAASGIAAGASAAATAVGTGLASLASATWSGVAAVGTGLASAGAALWTGLVTGLTLLGSGLASTGAALWRGLLALVDLTAAAVAAIGGAAAALLDAIATLGGILSGLWSRTPPTARPYVLAGAGTAGAGLLATALWRLLRGGALVALYSRIGRADVLDNEARNRVFEHIRANPGSNVSEIAEALGLGWGTTVYHLQKLAANGLVAEKRGGNSKCFFVNGGSLNPAEQRMAAAMKHEKAQLIVGYLQANPGVTQKEMAASLGMSPALVSFHVKRLVDAGVLNKARDGRATALALASDAAAPAIPA